MSDKKKSIQGDLFSNPAALMALKAMSPEQRADYQKMGQYMFTEHKFVDDHVINTMDNTTLEEASYIIEGLKSGMHPSYLEPNEIEILEDAYGKQWYKKFGYTKKDLRNIE